jgi:hypothetical protein
LPFWYPFVAKVVLSVGNVQRPRELDFASEGKSDSDRTSKIGIVMTPYFRPVDRLRSMTGLLVVSLLMGCGGNLTLNPFKWFGAREKTVAAIMIETPADPRPLIDTVASVRIEDVPSGVLVTALGRGVAQGVWQAALVARPVEDGRLILDFRAFDAPVFVEGTARSREVTAGLHLSRGTLDGIRSITVQGATNAISARP